MEREGKRIFSSTRVRRQDSGLPDTRQGKKANKNKSRIPLNSNKGFYPKEAQKTIFCQKTFQKSNVAATLQGNLFR
jgi:hypothetical protein